MSQTKIAVLLGILFVCLSAHAQTPSVYQNIVFSRTGQPLAGANVAICLSNPGVSTPPCHDLATTYTDITVGTQCVGSNALTYGTGCSNPGLTDGFGNYIIYASAGQTLWAQISGPRITTYIVPFIMPGGGSGGGGSVGPGDTHRLVRFTSSTTIGDAVCTDDNASPTRCPLGVNLATQALYIEKVNNPVTGTTFGLLVARDALGRAINAQPTDTNNVIGVADNGAGTSLSVQIAYSGRASCLFDNQTFIADWVTLGTSSQCHDAGATEPSGVENIGRVDSQNSGAGTLASVYLGLPDSTNTSTGGGTGIVQPCATTGGVGYFAGPGNTVGCDTAFTTDGAGNPSAKSFTLTGTTAGFAGFGQGSAPSFPQANTAYLYGGTSISTSFGTQLPSAIGSIGQVLTAKTTPDATHMTTDWETPGGVQSCDTSTQPGADLGLRINQCAAQIGFTISQNSGFDAIWVGTPGIIRVDSADAGPIVTQAIIPSNQTLSLGNGLYTNAFGQFVPPIVISDFSTVECDSHATIIQNTTQLVGENPIIGMANTMTCASPAPPPCGATGCQVSCSQPKTTGVTIRGCRFQESGSGSGTSLAGTLNLTNCVGCKVLDNDFSGILTTAVSLNGSYANNAVHPEWSHLFGQDDEIAGNNITGNANAGISVINAKNVHIHHNTFRDHGVGAAADIDLESNTPFDYMQYIEVDNNIFDCSKPQANTGCFGITQQSVGPNVGHMKLHHNIYYGPAIGVALSGQTSQGISSGNSALHGTSDIEIDSNQISNTSGPAITFSGVDYGSVTNNTVTCPQGATVYMPADVQHSWIANNRIASPQIVSFTVTSVATASGGTSVYTGTFTGGATSGLAQLTFQIQGFTTSANNGTFGAISSTATTLTLNNPLGVSETHAATARYGCTNSNNLGAGEQAFTTIYEADSTSDYNTYSDNIGAGQTIVKGTHSHIVNTIGASGSTDGSSQTFQVPTGFTSAIPGGIATTPLTAPVLSQFGPISIAPSCPSLSGVLFYIVTAVAPDGTQVPSNEYSQDVGVFGCPHPGWTYVPGAASYNVYRSTSSGVEQLIDNVPQGTLGYADAGGQTPTTAVPTSNSTGGVRITNGGVITGSTPQLDPRSPLFNDAGYICKGDGTDSAAHATKCWQNAEVYMQAHGGAVICPGDTSWTLNRVTMKNGDTFDGTTNQNPTGACTIHPSVDAAFVPFDAITPANHLSNVTFRNIYFVGGSNPIDIPFGNQDFFQNLQFRDPTGCGIVLIDGEREIFDNISSGHIGANGFATLCSGDKSKSLFAASISTANYGIARSRFNDIFEGGASPTFSSHWVWYAGDGTNGNIGETSIHNIGCFFSCSTGVFQSSGGVNVIMDGLYIDGVADGLSAEPVAFNFLGEWDALRISGVDMGNSGGNTTTQMFINTCTGCTVQNAWFDNSVDNSSTFALKLGNTFGGSLVAVRGGVFAANPGSINATGSYNLSPSNLLAGAGSFGPQLVDQNNADTYYGLCNAFCASLDTATAHFYRSIGSGSFADDLALTPSAAKFSKPLMTVAPIPACTFTSGGGTTPSCALDTGSSATAGIIKATTGSGSPAGTGTITLTFASALGTNKPVCQMYASDAGTAAWTAAPVFKDLTPTTASDVFTWTNGPVPTALSAASTYWINYQCWAK